MLGLCTAWAFSTQTRIGSLTRTARDGDRMSVCASSFPELRLRSNFLFFFCFLSDSDADADDLVHDALAGRPKIAASTDSDDVHLSGR